MPSFKPPQQFNFREPQGWPEWRSQFQRFRTASELTDKSGEVQVSIVHDDNIEFQIDDQLLFEFMLMEIRSVTISYATSKKRHEKKQGRISN